MFKIKKLFLERILIKIKTIGIIRHIDLIFSLQ